MRLRIAVTDNNWFRFLRARPGIDEVNFWKPGGRQRFRALEPDEFLLFKLHSPEDYIVGGGFFVYFNFFPYTLAWEAFQEKNGVATLDEMRRRIEYYRRAPVDLNAQIGCILTEPSSLRMTPGSSRPRSLGGASSKAITSTPLVSSHMSVSAEFFQPAFSWLPNPQDYSSPLSFSSSSKISHALKMLVPSTSSNVGARPSM